MIFKNLFRRKKPISPFGDYEIIEPWKVTGMNKVPSYIPKPSYSESSIPRKGPKDPEIKDKHQIRCMRYSCSLAKHLLATLKPYIKPGKTTDQLDKIAHRILINNGAYPSPLNYRGFPKSIYTSINNVAYHGIPDTRPLKHGDIITVDVTVYSNGYHGDCSRTFEVGKCDQQAHDLRYISELCLKKAINICKPNEKFSSIGNIIDETAHLRGCTVIPKFYGHGIGTYFHGPPYIFHNIGYENRGRMLPGMTFTIEPIVSQGDNDIKILKDGRTIATADDSRTAQFEHTVLITDEGCEVLTC